MYFDPHTKNDVLYIQNLESKARINTSRHVTELFQGMPLIRTDRRYKRS